MYIFSPTRHVTKIKINCISRPGNVRECQSTHKIFPIFPTDRRNGRNALYVTYIIHILTLAMLPETK